ncbi:MAG: DNA recombination protein RmuC [Clostridia bacterium]|nr:DNA recombination protein RmuC [Clostridia bacterium]
MPDLSFSSLLPGFIVALLAACLVLLVVLLIRQRRALEAQRESGLSQQDALEALSGALLDDLSAQKEENQSALLQANQSLLTTLSSISQSQTTLLESVQRQLLLSSRNQEEAMSALRQENDRQLADMRHLVDQRLSTTLEQRLDTSFSQVSTRLESVYEGIGEVRSLAAGVGDLKKVLTNVKTRGIWGEMQLAQLLRQTLAPSQYESNVAVVPGSAERVEFAILLPVRSERPVYLPVDSKFPQEDYLRLVEASQAGDAAAAEASRKALIRRLQAEARKISEKYIAPPHTTDFAILFLPVEGLYAEALQAPDLMASLQRDLHVVLSGPGTFSALLTSLQMGFRSMALEQRSTEVWQLLGEMRTDFNRFAEVLESTRLRLSQAGESIDSAVSRTRVLQRRLSSLETPVQNPLSVESEHTDELNH